ncbi:MAG TPA: site-specific integrase, partial [Streptosporangiaceae bacterium]|nr:site-specific integrase [Streptosporangiaceae bacterium]
NQVHLRTATSRQYEQALRLHILPALGDRPLATIRRSDVQSLVNAWAAQGASANAIGNAYFKALRLIFKNAVLDGLIVKSPCVAIKRPAIVAKQVVPLTVEQVTAIADEIEPRCRAAVLLGAGCGLRAGEITGLTEPDIRWMTRQIVVAQQLLRSGQLGPPKTRSSTRVVPAPDFVLEALSAHIASYGLGRDQVVFTRADEAARRSALGHLAAARRNHPGADASAQRRALAEVRESRSDSPLGERLRAAFTRAVRGVNAKAAERERDRKAGRTALPPLPSVPEDTSPHDLRHHYASVLIDGGESVVVVARRLGHANPSMTLNVYSHLFADSEERTRSVVDAAWNAKIIPVADSVRTSDSTQVSDLRR